MAKRWRFLEEFGGADVEQPHGQTRTSTDLHGRWGRRCAAETGGKEGGVRALPRHGDGGRNNGRLPDWAGEEGYMGPRGLMMRER